MTQPSEEDVEKKQEESDDRWLLEEAQLRAIRALQGAPLEGCGDNDCDDCYPK